MLVINPYYVEHFCTFSAQPLSNLPLDHFYLAEPALPTVSIPPCHLVLAP